MKRTVLQHVVCPSCHMGLDLTGNGAATRKEILSGRLVCASRTHRYPIESGVPRLLIKQDMPREQALTERSFSAKWRRAPDYLRQTGRFYTEWYLQRYGFRQLKDLRRFLANTRFILDAGTGTGRDNRLYAEHSPAQVFGIDISVGIQTAYRDLKAIPNLHLLRANIMHLPFRNRFFDFIACDQVLHHTADPKASLQQLVNRLRAGGHLAFYVYRRKGPVREFCDDYLRAVTTKMSEQECYRFAEAVTKFGKTLAEQQVTIRVPEDIPLLQLKAGRYDLQRFFHWNVFKCFWNKEFSKDTNAVINFDWYHPTSAYRYTEEQMRQWCEECGLQIERMNVVEAGISVLALKRA